MMDFLLLFCSQIQIVYLMYLVATNFTSMVLIGLAFNKIVIDFFDRKESFSENMITRNAYRPVSILVPAYNEEATIITSVNSFMRMHFPEFEVIVINDGSKDRSMEKLINAFSLYVSIVPANLELKHKNIKNLYRSSLYHNLFVVDKENGGKADALNSGINISSYPLFCCVDADSILEPKSIIHALDTFIEDRRVIASGSTIGILNGSIIDNGKIIEKRVPNTFVESMQVMEYLRGFLSGRLGWEKVGGLLIISGAFGIFRKDIVMNIQGYRHTIGEDFDLLVRMRKYCYDHKIAHRVSFIGQTMCWTQAPSDYASLLKQRNRWHRGLLETLFYNRKMIFNAKYGVVGLLSLPYFIFIEAGGAFVTLLGILSLMVLYIFNMVNHDTIYLFFLLEFVWGISLNVASLSLEIFSEFPYKSTKHLFKLFILGFLEPFFYRPFMKIEQFMASFNFLNSNWGEIKRKSIE